MVKRAAILVLAVLFVAAGGAMGRIITLDADRDSQLMNAGCGGNSNKGWGGKGYMSGAGGGTEHNDTILMSFDLSGVALAPGEYVAAGTLTFYAAGGGNNYDWGVDCYAMSKAWVEGVGVPTDGFGGTGYPWGPCSVGDSCQNYQVVSDVGLGSGSFATQMVATGGTPWDAPSAKGANDCDRTRPMTTGALAGAQVGDKEVLGTLALTADGCDVVEEWITGSLANNGLVMILIDNRDPNSVMHLGMREYGAAGPPETPGDCAPELEIEIIPEPACMALLALGAVALVRRKR